MWTNLTHYFWRARLCICHRQVEEFDAVSDKLMLRKVRSKSTLGKLSEWRTVVGEPDSKAFNPDRQLIARSTSNPVFLRQDSPSHFQWRVRNIPYERSVYRLSIDPKRQQIVLRTTNKKYFKRIDVPEMKALDMKLRDDPQVLTYTHQSNTLVIQYKKPKAILQAEAQYRQERANVPAKPTGKEGDVDCKQQ